MASPGCQLLPIIGQAGLPIVWPLLVYAAAVLILAAAMIGISCVLGQRRARPDRAMPYESGMAPTGSARQRLSVKYFRVALFFVIFDLEAVYLFAWAIAVRKVGWSGYIETVIFVGVLMAALVYLGREGALDWETSRRLDRTTEQSQKDP